MSTTITPFVPSISLLRAFSRPSTVRTISCPRCQIRPQSTKFPNFIPRHKYAKVNRLDKLHRQQKATAEQEKEKSRERAALLEETFLGGNPATDVQNLPFHMGRTASKNLPVYEVSKDGGSKHITQIRKLSGDLREMQRALRAALQLPEALVDRKGSKTDPVAINHLTQQIIIKGWRGPEVKKWADMVGF